MPSYSKYNQVPPMHFGTALTGSGTPLAAPADSDDRYRLDFVSFWLTDPADSNTVTLTLGSVTLPAVGLSSSRSAFSMGPLMMSAGGAVTVTLSGSASVGFFGQYVLATGD